MSVQYILLSGVKYNFVYSVALIEIRMSSDKEDINAYQSQAGSEIQFSAFMSGIALFFIGLILTGDPDRQVAIEVPLAYLFVSAFAFFYAALIYANASSESPAVIKNSIGYQISWANALSETLGVYNMGFALPIAVAAYTQNVPLSIVVLGAHVTGYLIYHFLGFSILERNVRRPYFELLSLMILILYTISFVLYLNEYMTAFYITTGALGIAVVLTLVSVGTDLLSPD